MNTASRENTSKNIIWFGVLTIALTGIYNSLQLSPSSYDQNLGIKFVKRLDEMQGRVVVGRMAASLQKWSPLDDTQKKVPSIQALRKKVLKTPKKSVVAQEKVEVADNSDTRIIPEPAISEELNLELTQVFHKKPLDKKSFNGYAQTYDGYIQKLVVTLPNGKTINIDTRERMIGNVFQYEDTQTGEPKSGLMYEVKKGEQYMVTLTDDSAYAGLRLGFKTNENSELKYQYDQYYNNPVEAVEKNDKAYAQNDNYKGQNQDNYDNYYDQQQGENTQQNPYDNGGYSFDFSGGATDSAQI